LDCDLDHREIRIAATLGAADGDLRFDRIAGADGNGFRQFDSFPGFIGCQTANDAMRSMVVVPMAVTIEARLDAGL